MFYTAVLLATVFSTPMTAKPIAEHKVHDAKNIQRFHGGVIEEGYIPGKSKGWKSFLAHRRERQKLAQRSNATAPANHPADLDGLDLANEEAALRWLKALAAQHLHPTTLTSTAAPSTTKVKAPETALAAVSALAEESKKAVRELSTAKAAAAQREIEAKKAEADRDAALKQVAALKAEEAAMKAGEALKSEEEESLKRKNKELEETLRSVEQTQKASPDWDTLVQQLQLAQTEAASQEAGAVDAYSQQTGQSQEPENVALESLPLPEESTPGLEADYPAVSNSGNQKGNSKKRSLVRREMPDPEEADDPVMLAEPLWDEQAQEEDEVSEQSPDAAGLVPQNKDISAGSNLKVYLQIIGLIFCTATLLMLWHIELHVHMVNWTNDCMVYMNTKVDDIKSQLPMSPEGRDSYFHVM